MRRDLDRVDTLQHVARCGPASRRRSDSTPRSKANCNAPRAETAIMPAGTLPSSPPPPAFGHSSNAPHVVLAETPNHEPLGTHPPSATHGEAGRTKGIGGAAMRSAPLACRFHQEQGSRQFHGRKGRWRLASGMNLRCFRATARAPPPRAVRSPHTALPNIAAWSSQRPLVPPPAARAREISAQRARR